MFTSHSVSPHLTASHSVSPHLTASHSVSPHLTTSHSISPHLTVFHHISQCLTVSHSVPPHLITKSCGISLVTSHSWSYLRNCSNSGTACCSSAMSSAVMAGKSVSNGESLETCQQMGRRNNNPADGSQRDVR